MIYFACSYLMSSKNRIGKLLFDINKEISPNVLNLLHLVDKNKRLPP